MVFEFLGQKELAWYCSFKTKRASMVFAFLRFVLSRTLVKKSVQLSCVLVYNSIFIMIIYIEIFVNQRS